MFELADSLLGEEPSEDDIPNDITRQLYEQATSLPWYYLYSLVVLLVIYVFANVWGMWLVKEYFNHENPILVGFAIGYLGIGLVVVTNIAAHARQYEFK